MAAQAPTTILMRLNALTYPSPSLPCYHTVLTYWHERLSQERYAGRQHTPLVMRLELFSTCCLQNNAMPFSASRDKGVALTARDRQQLTNPCTSHVWVNPATGGHESCMKQYARSHTFEQLVARPTNRRRRKRARLFATPNNTRQHIEQLRTAMPSTPE